MSLPVAARHTTIVNLVGVFLILLALIVGGIVGHMINLDAPAQATTPTDAPAPCAALCNATNGSGGEAPNPLNGSSGGGNRN